MDVFDFRKTRTANGVPVHFKYLPWTAGWLHARVLLHTGAFHDLPEKLGASHLLEHLLLEGTKVMPGGRTLQQIDDDIFMGSLNGTTGLYAICFEGRFLKKDLAAAMAAFEDIVLRPVIIPDTFSREKLVTIEEMRDNGDTDDAQNKIERIYHRDIYGRHRLGALFSVGGTVRAVQRMTRDDLIRRHATAISTGNLSLVFAGDINAAEAELAGEQFSRQLPTGTRTLMPLPAASWPAPRVPGRTYRMKKDFNTSTSEYEIDVARAFPAPKNAEMLRIVENMTQHALFRAIREELGACYRVNIDSMLHPDHRFFKINTCVNPDLGEKACAVIRRTLAELRTEKCAPLFEVAQTQLIKVAPVNDFNVDSIATMAVDDLTFGDRIISQQEIKKQREAVRLADVLKLLNEEFAAENLYWSVMKP